MQCVWGEMCALSLRCVARGSAGGLAPSRRCPWGPGGGSGSWGGPSAPPPGALVVRGSTGAGRRPVWVCVHVVWGVRSRGGWGPPYLVLQCECVMYFT